MKEQTINKARLGAFVLSGTLLLVIGLYYIGSKENIFHSTITVSSEFHDVQGLMAGNNVRFNGIDVGTVSKVYPVADTAIRVEFTIDEDTRSFIGKDASVVISTDGLLGNKLINISPGNSSTPAVEEGDILHSIEAPDMAAAMSTLNITNENIRQITENLKGITEKFNSNNSLWHLLNDSAIAENVRSAVVSFQITGNNSAVITGDLRKIFADVRSGKGTVGALLTDTVIYDNLQQTIIKLEAVSDSVAIITGDFHAVLNDIHSGKGAVGTLLTDTSFVGDLNQSMTNIRKASGTFNQHMEALKLSWPFKKYFRKQEDKQE